MYLHPQGLTRDLFRCIRAEDDARKRKIEEKRKSRNNYLHEIAEFDANGAETRDTSKQIRVRQHALFQITVLKILMHAQYVVDIAHLERFISE